jgi:hypothetical protein
MVSIRTRQTRQKHPHVRTQRVPPTRTYHRSSRPPGIEEVKGVEPPGASDLQLAAFTAAFSGIYSVRMIQVDQRTGELKLVDLPVNAASGIEPDARAVSRSTGVEDKGGSTREAVDEILPQFKAVATEFGVSLSVLIEGLRESLQVRATHADPPAFDERTIALLEQGGLDVRAPVESAPDIAVETNAKALKLLSESLDVDGVATLLGVDPSRVRQRLRARTLYGVRDGGGWRVPEAQFANREQIRGLGRVFQCLRDGQHPVAIWNWLTNPDPDLEADGRPMSPLDWLRTGGDVDIVCSIATEL